MSRLETYIPSVKKKLADEAAEFAASLPEAPERDTEVFLDVPRELTVTGLFSQKQTAFSKPYMWVYFREEDVSESEVLKMLDGIEGFTSVGERKKSDRAAKNDQGSRFSIRISKDKDWKAIHRSVVDRLGGVRLSGEPGVTKVLPLSQKPSDAASQPRNFDDADAALADSVLDELLGSSTPKAKPEPKKRLGKAKSGQYEMFPGVAQDIDRQDAIDKARRVFMDGIDAWVRGNERRFVTPEVLQPYNEAVKNTYAAVGGLLKKFYSSKEQYAGDDEIRGSEGFAEVYSDLELEFMDDADVGLDALDDALLSAVKSVVADRPVEKPKKIGEKKDKPKTKLQEKADQATDDFKASGKALVDAIKNLKTKPTVGLDAEVMRLAVRFAYDGVKAGTLNFAAFVEKAYNNFTDDIDLLVPYLEAGWDALHRRNLVEDPAGNAKSVVAGLKQAKESDVENADQTGRTRDTQPVQPDRGTTDGEASANPADAPVLGATQAKMYQSLSEAEVLKEFAILQADRFNKDLKNYQSQMKTSEAELMAADHLMLTPEADEEEVELGDRPEADKRLMDEEQIRPLKRLGRTTI